ncbi:hypothetical protein HDE_06113 [Halotydeus destructor]|nr:hypothetical protein HDE_06113 [Halotydeus destructor]
MKPINLITLLFIMYQVNWITCHSFCGFQDPVRNKTRPSRLGADFQHPVRYLKVFLVADYELYTKWFNGSEDKLNTYMEERIRYTNELYKELNLHLMVTGRVVEADKAHLAQRANMTSHVMAMNEHVAKRYGKEDYESLVYFTGYHIAGMVAGIAAWRSVCSVNRAVLVRNHQHPEAIPVGTRFGPGSGGGQVPMGPLAQPFPAPLTPLGVAPQGWLPYATANFAGNPVEQNGYQQLPPAHDQNGQGSYSGTGLSGYPVEQNGGVQGQSQLPDPSANCISAGGTKWPPAAAWELPRWPTR